jgi:lipopolysaccharide export system protein LptA
MKTLSLLLLLLPISLWSQEKITINNVDELSLGFRNGRKAKVCVGNVSFSQGEMTLTCQKAYLYDNINEVEAIGNVYITQPGATISGQNLYYYGNSNEAVLSNNVVYNDGESTLTTNSLRYNTKSKYGYYSNGATILNKNNTLTSTFGSYSGFSKIYGFKKNVKLVNPEYVMESDTLQYHVNTSTAYFYGPTTITAEDNIIYCKYGWYNTDTEKSLFTKGATIYSKKNTISADSLLYDRLAAIGRAYGNIEMIDSIEQVVIYGHQGTHYRNGGLTTITGTPLAKKAMEEGDSLWLIADTFNYINDDSIRVLTAFRNSKILTEDMLGVCDSLSYNVTDSAIHMFVNPVLWTEENEISGISMSIELRNNKIDQLSIFDSAWIIQEEAKNHYNQIVGDTMYNYFRDNKLDNVLVISNARSIYYARENDTAYTGVNSITCYKMRIQLDSQKVKKITFYNKPKAILYPVNKFPKTQRRLEGFKLYTERKPKRKWFKAREPRFRI